MLFQAKVRFFQVEKSKKRCFKRTLRASSSPGFLQDSEGFVLGSLQSSNGRSSVFAGGVFRPLEGTAEAGGKLLVGLTQLKSLL